MKRHSLTIIVLLVCSYSQADDLKFTVINKVPPVKTTPNFTVINKCPPIERSSSTYIPTNLMFSNGDCSNGSCSPPVSPQRGFFRRFR